MASPITVKYDQLRGGLGYDAKKESPNFSPVWKGGEWHLRDITNYMTTAAFSLLKHAANNREEWLSRFYTIGKEAVQPRKDGELFGFVIPSRPNSGFGYPQDYLSDVLRRGGVEIEKTDKGDLVKIAQPYGAFAKALIERQHYPNLRDEKGNPIPPYDVTANTLSLFYNLDIKTVNVPFEYRKLSGFELLQFGGLIGCDVRGSAYLLGLSQIS